MITIGRRPPPSNDVVDALLECHERMRRFLAIGERLAGAHGAPEPEVQNAARDLERYFSGAFLRHAEDEDVRVLPTLVEAGAPITALQAELRAQHQALDQALGGLLLAWRRLIAAPKELDALRAELQSQQAHFAALLSSHLAKEEAELMPLARRTLQPEHHLRIKAAMDHARGLA